MQKNTSLAGGGQCVFNTFHINFVGFSGDFFCDRTFAG